MTTAILELADDEAERTATAIGHVFQCLDHQDVKHAEPVNRGGTDALVDLRNELVAELTAAEKLT